MKKLKLIVILIVFLLSASACQNYNYPNVSGDTATVSPETTIFESEADLEIARETENKENEQNEDEIKMINIKIGDNVFAAALEKNSSTDALLKLLKDGPITINMRDYGNMEKVGMFPQNLPTNDQHITTEPGDLILYQGNAFVIYYAPNTWSFTKLGKINDVTANELKRVLGDGNVDVVLSLISD